MTTIAWDGKTLAADTLGTCNGLREGHAPKAVRIGGVILAGDGSRALFLRFRAWFFEGRKGPCPYEDKEAEGNGIAIQDGVLTCWGPQGPWPVTQRLFAIGSGYPVALGAMHAGADARRAVEIAISLDTGSGGEITVLEAT